MSFFFFEVYLICFIHSGLSLNHRTIVLGFNFWLPVLFFRFVLFASYFVLVFNKFVIRYASLRH
ncbi:hypothetical protein JHK87_036309 [Glycine soja]|nr:hypothetical protein JHK87_036309 [Glycine soja]